MLFIFDRELTLCHAIPDISNIKSGDIIEQINGEHSCTLVIPWDDTTSKMFQEFYHIGFYIEDRFEVYTIRQIDDDKDGYAERTIYCEHLSYDMVGDIVEDRRIINGSAKDIITRILEVTDWQVGEIASLGDKTYNAYYIPARQALLEIAQVYGGELRFRIELNEDKTGIAGKYVDLLTTRGDNTGIRFTSEKNLNNITRSIDTLNVYTRMIGRGYSPSTDSGGQERRIQFGDVEWLIANGNPMDKPLGQNWVSNPEAEAKYGIIVGVYQDESKTPEDLLQNTWNALSEASIPKITYTADLLFIKSIMGDKKILRLGDHFTIIDDDLGLTINTRIISITYDFHDPNIAKVTMGQFYNTIGDESELDEIKNQIDSIRDQINSTDTDIDIDDGSFPDTVPARSVITTRSLFACIHAQWTYEYKSYYEYALYGSQTKGFAPTSQNLLFRGKASSFAHYVQPDQTWYYRVCAYNTHGSRNEFSIEAKASSLKITTAEDYMESASIGDALIGELRLDRGWVGKLTGHHIDARELTVTDGNGVETFRVDSFGRLHGNFTTLNIAVGGDGNIPTKDGVAKEIAGATEIIDIQLKDIVSANQNVLEQINLITDDDYITETERADIKNLYHELHHQYNTMLGTVAKFDNEYLNSYVVLLTVAYETVEPIMSVIMDGATDGALTFRNALTDYYNKYNDCLYAISAFTKDQLTELSARITANANGIQMAVSQSAEDIAEIKKHMSFTANGWLELHGSINGQATQFKMQLSDTKLAFFDGGNEVASVSNKKLNIENAEIRKNLTIGGYIMSPSARGGIVFKKGV